MRTMLPLSKSGSAAAAGSMTNPSGVITRDARAARVLPRSVRPLAAPRQPPIPVSSPGLSPSAPVAAVVPAYPPGRAAPSRRAHARTPGLDRSPATRRSRRRALPRRRPPDATASAAAPPAPACGAAHRTPSSAAGARRRMAVRRRSLRPASSSPAVTCSSRRNSAAQASHTSTCVSTAACVPAPTARPRPTSTTASRRLWQFMRASSMFLRPCRCSSACRLPAVPCPHLRGVQPAGPGLDAAATAPSPARTPVPPRRRRS